MNQTRIYWENCFPTGGMTKDKHNADIGGSMVVEKAVYLEDRHSKIMALEVRCVVRGW
jgi:hypothetical protein